MVVAVGAGCNGSRDSGGRQPVVTESESNSNEIQSLVAAEELILRLTPLLKSMNDSALNLRVPIGRATDLFSDSVQFVGIESQPGSSELNGFVSTFAWDLRASMAVSKPEFEFWAPLFKQVKEFQHAKFYFVDGKLDENDSAQKLESYREIYNPSYEFLKLNHDQVVLFQELVEEQTGTTALPSSVVINGEGIVPGTFQGLPNASQLIRFVEKESNR